MAPRPASSARALDALLAAAFVALGWLSSSATAQTEPDFVYTPRDGVFLALLVLACGSWAAHRRHPAGTFLAVLLSTAGIWLLGYDAGATPLLILLAAYFVALRCTGHLVIACGVAALVCFGTLWAGGGAPYGAVEALASVLGVLAMLALGRAGRLRGDLATARGQAVEEAARLRASEERLRVAQELHDIIGHSLGTIAVQAGVGRHLMDADPAAGADALSNIARISRTSLGEVRAAVATLRDGEPSYSPTPGLDDVPRLVEDARLAGLEVHLTLPDQLEAISRPAQAAIYRIVRESLSNVVRHSAASEASVRLSRRGRQVDLSIRDAGPPRDPARSPGFLPGHGITGMQERAGSLGGHVTAGPAADGGFVVTATIPGAGDGSR